MKKSIIFLVLILSALAGFSQSTRKVELKPIYMNGGNFYYGDKRVHDGYALQIPLQSIDDNEVNKRFQSFKDIRALNRFIGLAPLIYLVATSNNNQTYKQRFNSFAIFVLGTIGVNITLNLISNHQLKKGVERYNYLIIDRTKVGFQYSTLPYGQGMLGLNFTANIDFSRH